MARNENAGIMEMRMEGKARMIGFALKAVRAGVEMIVGAGGLCWNEVRDELAKLPAKERAAFAAMAKETVEQLSDYVEAV